MAMNLQSIHPGGRILKNLPQTGEKNTLFGVFKSACCGAEIVIMPSSEFPACPNHPLITAFWEPIETEPDNVSFSSKKTKIEPAA
jgi:hypothetical protein